jgi:hypothetical protein
MYIKTFLHIYINLWICTKRQIFLRRQIYLLPKSGLISKGWAEKTPCGISLQTLKPPALPPPNGSAVLCRIEIKAV